MRISLEIFHKSNILCRSLPAAGGASANGHNSDKKWPDCTRNPAIPV
jgi:hypothetical protein